MQSQGFRSSKQLALYNKEYLALQKTYAAFVMGQIKWFDRNNVSAHLYRHDLQHRYPFKGYFNMVSSCDNVKGYGCVGDLHSVILFLTKCDMPTRGNLRYLLYPNEIDRADLIKPDMAAKAIFNYLTYEDPNWRACVPRHVYNNYSTGVVTTRRLWR